jgi:hypothetical protein
MTGRKSLKSVKHVRAAEKEAPMRKAVSGIALYISNVSSGALGTVLFEMATQTKPCGQIASCPVSGTLLKFRSSP